MPANPLMARKKGDELPLNSQAWCDRGNAYLRGEIPGTNGRLIDKPRHDVEWVVQNGRATIRWKP